MVLCIKFQFIELFQISNIPVGDGPLDVPLLDYEHVKRGVEGAAPYNVVR